MDQLQYIAALQGGVESGYSAYTAVLQGVVGSGYSAIHHLTLLATMDRLKGLLGLLHKSIFMCFHAHGGPYFNDTLLCDCCSYVDHTLSCSAVLFILPLPLMQLEQAGQQNAVESIHRREKWSRGLCGLHIAARWGLHTVPLLTFLLQ